MTTLGFCTHFTQTDQWAFDYALRLCQQNDWQLNICHWLQSPYRLRRDIVFNDLIEPSSTVTVTPQLLTRFELHLREYYDPKLGDFTNVAFKLCEGSYQVELMRCLRQHLLDLIVMGYQPFNDEPDTGATSITDFISSCPYPVILVGIHGEKSYLLNQAALLLLDQLDIPAESWELIVPEKAHAPA